MKLCSSSICRGTRLLFAIVMLVCWTGAVDGAQRQVRAQAAAEKPAADGKSDADQLLALADGIDKAAKMISAVKPLVDRTTFDPQAVVSAVGNNPNQLADWVAKNTSFAPYAGCLRGPVGVLMDRNGNSLDRALLLARLLQLAHVPIRLAHGTLSPAQVKDLLDRSNSVPKAANAPAEDLDKTVAKISAATGVPAAQVRQTIEAQQLEAQKAAEKVVDTVSDESDRLLAALGKEMTAKAPPSQDAEKAADHWWVQYNAGGKWMDADPQAPATDAGKSWCKAEEATDIGDDLYKPIAGKKLMHAIGVRVRFERVGPKGAEQLTAMERSFATAKLGGQSLSFAMVPLYWPGDLDLSGADGPQKLKATLLAQHSWLPMFVFDGKPDFQSSFDDTGTLDPHPTLDSLGQAGKVAANKLQGAADAFDTKPPAAAAASALTAAWIEFDITVPGRATQTIRRDLFDLYTAAQRKAGPPAAVPALGEKENLRRSAALYRTIDLLPTGCIISQEYTTTLAVDQIQKNTAEARDALRLGAKGSTTAAFDKIGKIRAQPIPLYALASLRNSIVAPASDIVVDRPNLFARQRSIIVHDDGSIVAVSAMDIVCNGVSARGAEAPFAKQVRQGVMDTYAEAMAMGTDAACNTSVIYHASAMQKIPWNLIKDANDPALRGAGFSETTRSRIAADLAAGFVVVAPQKAVTLSNKTYEGWWRIDPATGGTVGYMANGLGAAAVEYDILVTSICMGILTFIGCGGVSAVAQGNSLKALGCLACGIFVGVLAYFGGAAAAQAARGVAATGVAGWAGGLGGYRAGAARVPALA